MPIATPQNLEAALRQGLAALSLPLPDTAVAQLLAYLAQLQKWNKVYNLTSVRDPGEMLTHHLLDSLAVVPSLQRALAASAGRLTTTPQMHTRVLDVGSGGGLPGVVLAIACPAWQVLCVDTVSKKAAFIQQVAATVGLPNLRSAHARVEQLQAEPFDVVTSRAFASLTDFVNLTRFHVKQSPQPGMWMAMKAKRPDAEVAALPSFARLTGIEPLHVPGLEEERCLVWMDQPNAPV